MTNKHVDFVMGIKNITHLERVIFIYLINTANEEYTVNSNQTEIAYKCSCSVAKVYSAIKNLTKKGFLEKLKDNEYKIIFS